MNTINLSVASLRFAAEVATHLPASLGNEEEVKITIEKKKAKLYGGNNQLIRSITIPHQLHETLFR